MILSDNIVKAFKAPGVIAGSSGDLVDLAALARWLEEGAHLSKLKVGNKVWGIIVYGSSRGVTKVYRVEDGGYIEVPMKKGETAAFGSGREVAQGALDMGATPEEAVAIAKKRISSCGGITTVVTL